MTGTRKYLCWVMVALMFLAVLSGGCGGGSSGGSSPNNNQSQQNEQDDTTHDTDTPNIYSISQLTGTWVASSGSGTGTGTSGSYSFSLDTRVILGEFDEFGSTVLTQSSTWYVYQDGNFVRRLIFTPNTTSMKLTATGTNTWKATFPNSDTTLPESDVTITLTSATTANVREAGSVIVEGEQYNYVAEYTMAK